MICMTHLFCVHLQLIGSSLLFVHNADQAVVWLIDFAKSIPLPSGVSITHRAPWVEGSHEDGYLLGLDNLITLMAQLEHQMQSTEQQSTSISSEDIAVATVAQNNNESDIHLVSEMTSNEIILQETDKIISNVSQVRSANSNDNDLRQSSKNDTRQYLPNIKQTKELPLKGCNSTSPCPESSHTDIMNLVTNAAETNSIS